MSILEVPGARLYYETAGSGPLLLMVHGANGTGDVFNGIIEPLAEHYTVVTYDRRGFTRSKLVGAQDYTNKLRTDASDARLLIEHLSDQPATVFGSSSGAIVALEALINHPSAVRMLFPHEPPVVELLPDGQEWVNFFSEVYDIFHRSGMEPALKKFRERVLAESDKQSTISSKRSEYTVPNFHHWIEHELLQYTTAGLDYDAIKLLSNRVKPLAGRDSCGYPSYEATLLLGRVIGKNVTELPGGHNGYLTMPSEFARELVKALMTERQE